MQARRLRVPGRLPLLLQMHPGLLQQTVPEMALEARRAQGSVQVVIGRKQARTRAAVPHLPRARRHGTVPPDRGEASHML